MDCFTGINILTLPYLRFKRSEGFCWNVGNMIIVGKPTLKISKVRKEAAEKSYMNVSADRETLVFDPSVICYAPIRIKFITWQSQYIDFHLVSLNIPPNSLKKINTVSVRRCNNFTNSGERLEKY